MPRHTDNSSDKVLQTFWPCLYSILFAVLISACQAENPKASSPVAKESKQLTKPTSRPEWRSLLGWSDDCEQSFSSTQAGNYAEIETHTLGDADELVIVMCAVGSYQPSFMLYRLKGQTPNALALETYLSSDGEILQRSQETELWGEPVFNANTRELVILTASRQTKDCGTWAKYSFRPDNMTKLLDFRVKLPCPDEIKQPVNLVPANPPEGWKLVKNM
jgi:hypothetical protein